VADGGNSVRNILEPVGEPFRPEMQMYSVAKELGTHSMWQLQLERTDLCKAYLDRWNRYDGLDAILCMSECDSMEICALKSLTHI
jgi:amidase